MADPSVSERRIRPIQDAVESGSWKQALQQCDKWFKKGERSDRFLALKAFVLASQADKSQHDRGKREALDLCQRNPPITEPEAIYQLQSALKLLSLAENRSMLWERAIATKKEDRDLYMRWINQAIADNDWRSAQKATMSMRKAFPTEREYEFWNILACHVLHLQRSVPEKERAMFGTLAYRMIVKAAEAVQTEEAQSATSKAISTPEELALLVQILNATQHPDEALELLQGSSLGIESAVGKKDPQLHLSLLLDVLQLCEPGKALDACAKLLSQPEHQADDRVWNVWLKARPRPVQAARLADSEKLLETVCSVQPLVRSAHLARMEFLRTKQDGDINQDALFKCCKDYHGAFGDKSFCFDDLKKTIQVLDKHHKNELLKLALETGGNPSQLLALKVKYTLLPGDVAQQSSSTSSYLDFAFEALNFYLKSLSSPPSSPEAGLLAVLALLGGAENAPEAIHAQYTTLATLLLEVIRSKSEDYYILTILLVQIQSHLGLLSLAMEHFIKLSPKNMQWETVGHLILTRISTLHPAYSGSRDDLEPVKALRDGLAILDKADLSLVRGVREALRFNSYSNVLNSINMRIDIEDSINKQMYTIEERKVARWRGEHDQTTLPHLKTETEFANHRDLSYLPSYRQDDGELLSMFRCGPLPQESWVRSMFLRDNVALFLRAEQDLNVGLASQALENIKLHLDHVLGSAPRPTPVGQFTECESHDLLAILSVAKAITLQGVVDMSDRTSMSELLTTLGTHFARLLEERQRSKTFASTAHISGVYFPRWEVIHTSLTHLETLRIATDFCAWLNKKQVKGGSKNTRNASLQVDMKDIVQVQTVVKDLEARIHADAKGLKAQVNGPGVLGKLVDFGMARSRQVENGTETTSTWMWDEMPNREEWENLLEKVCDEVTMETICGRMRESWDDVLDGVLQSKGRSGATGDR